MIGTLLGLRFGAAQGHIPPADGAYLAQLVAAAQISLAMVKSGSMM
jgi:hypothetical protein